MIRLLRSSRCHCVCLELRSLPSTGVTQLQRYYHPPRPQAARPVPRGLPVGPCSDPAMGFPVLRPLSLCTCCSHYPGAASGRIISLGNPAVSAFPERVVGSACASSFSRFAQRSLSLRPAHSRCHQFVTRIPKASASSFLLGCSGCFRLERSPGGPCTHWKAPPCHGAHPQQTFG